ncbi:hypothetical protein U1Q18_032895 [Sarracenia purpurea var. burkii]
MGLGRIGYIWDPILGLIPFVAVTQRKSPGVCNGCWYESGASCDGYADPTTVQGSAHNGASRKNIEQGRGKEWETNHSSPERSGRPIILPPRIETATEYPPQAGLRLELRHPHLAGERDDEPKA